MKKGLFFLIPVLFLYSSSIIAVTYNSEPKIFVQELVDDAVKSAISDKEIGVIVIHDKNWKELEPSLRKKLSNSVKPTVIAIGSEVDQGLRDRIKTAVGVDLWK